MIVKKSATWEGRVYREKYSRIFMSFVVSLPISLKGRL